MKAIRTIFKSLKFAMSIVIFISILQDAGSSFHTEDSDQTDSAQVVSVNSGSVIQSLAPGSDEGLNPFSMVSCHIGHCSHILIPETFSKLIELRRVETISSLMRPLVGRSLDAPFTPPRQI